ncbi:sensor histidine kinase [Nocardioides marmoribigeumensis]|uniref:histidine kinase n=1 Tax=Nocardioides marmoribigeumensis TaxID=433649 RepID=A0ABU2BUU0_9ACTN|nr:HAMP domain-containing sensor histidine kinase [Nocardioides marmoribigeumensis]MDR7362401.1 signal transduction histidine kinase [Nocardioides marmoribigeumensis]
MSTPQGAEPLSSYRRRAVVATAALATLAALVLLLVAHLAFEDTSDAAVERVLRTRAEGVVAEARGLSTGSVPVVRGLPPDVVVYDAAATAVAGVPPRGLERLYARLSTSPRDRVVRATTERGAVKVMARRFVLGTGAVGVVVVTEPLDPYADEQQEALLVAAVAGVVIVVLTTLAAALVSRRVLAPVTSMARTAEEWSEHDLDRRFDLGPPRNEIEQLGHTLDGLLDKVARAILAEQRLTSELAHELRTPLTTVAAAAELVAQRDDLDEDLRADVEEIRASCRSMAATITSLLEVARALAHGTGRCDLAETVAEVVRGLGGQDRTTVRVPATGVAAPADLAARALAPVVDNALRLADHVSVTAEVEDGRVRVLVSDDGPGVGDQEVFTTRGLGLPLARRVARSLGGDVRLRPGGGPGATFEVVLPTAH